MRHRLLTQVSKGTVMRKILAAMIVAGALATAPVYAADSADASMTWVDSFNAWAFGYVQTVAGWFGYCYPDITGKKCI